MKYFAYQIEKNSCGFACANMLLAYYHKNKELIFGEFVKLASLLDVKKYLENNGLKTTGVKIERKYLDKVFNNSIAHIIEGENKHFVVLKKIGKKYIKLYDPSRGLRIIKKESFFEIFDGILLIVEEVNKLDKKIKVKKNRCFTISFIFSLIIDFLIVYLFTYIVKTNDLFLVLLLSSIILINFVFKFLIIFGYNSYLDKYLVEPYVNKFDIKTLELFVNYKTNLIQSKFKKISYFLISIFGLLLLLINSIFNFIILFELIAFIIIKTTIIRRYLLLKKEESYRIQRKYLFNKKENYRNLNKISKKYALAVILYYILIIVIIFITILLIGKSDDKFSLSYIIFSMMTTLTIFELFNRYLYSINEEKDNLNLLKNRIYKLLMQIKK